MKPDFTPVYSELEEKAIRKEFSRTQGVCYLDQAGSALYPKSLIERVTKDLSENLYSNPHSKSTSGKHCQDTVDQVRYRILQHFNTDVDHYHVVFTSGATAALKLVAEAFLWSKDDDESPWLPRDEKPSPKGEFVYMEDNHTSVLGMRDVVNEKGVNVRCLSHEQTLDLLEKSPSCVSASSSNNSLFVYSAQCNFSGVKYPLSWIQRVHRGALQSQPPSSSWYVLLDAACFLSTSTLDLSLYQPDFVTVSFYKIFGFPTGLGALLVRNESAQNLRKKFYGGGTVQVSLSSELAYVPRPILHESFEDGTIDFLSIVALLYGFEVAFEVLGGFEKLSRHAFSLAEYLFNRLLSLHHRNGAPAVQLYADSDYSSEETQGGIVNFNMLRSNGEFIGFAEVQHMANLYNIQLRTGCFCNPGACKRHLHLSTDDVKSHFNAGHICGDDRDLVNGRPTGSVRVSFGIVSTLNDANKLVQMLVDCFVDKAVWKTPNDWHHRGKIIASKFSLNEDTCSQLPLSKIATSLSQNGLAIEYPEKSQRSFGVRLSHLFLYPVKSCGALAVDKWTMDERGLQYDRLWMVTEHSGIPLTQKKEPKLCLVKPKIDLVSKQLHLTFPGFERCSIPLDPPTSTSQEVALCQSKVCGDRIQGLDCGAEVALWLSDVLLRPDLRLIRQVSEDKRSTKMSKNALSLNNQAQFLLISQASVAWLAEQISNDSDCSKDGLVHRFRSNFVLVGVNLPFEEQRWSKVAIGDVQFGVEGPCRRCQMVCIDQETGELTKEPLTTISAACQGKVLFGIYLCRVDAQSGPNVISMDSPVTFS